MMTTKTVMVINNDHDDHDDHDGDHDDDNGLQYAPLTSKLAFSLHTQRE